MKAITRTRLLGLGVRILSCPQTLAERWKEQLKREACAADSSAHLFPGSCIYNAIGTRARIQIGARTVIRGELNIFPPSGSIKIGSYCYIGDHSRIWSAVGVAIGDRVLISHSVNIHDHSGHPKSATKRHLQTVEIFDRGTYDLTDVGMARITIEDDAWIGFNATILAGVTIGKGAIIGAAAMITKDVAPYAVVVGNPGRQVATVTEDSH